MERAAKCLTLGKLPLISLVLSWVENPRCSIWAWCRCHERLCSHESPSPGCILLWMWSIKRLSSCSAWLSLYPWHLSANFKCTWVINPSGPEAGQNSMIMWVLSSGLECTAKSAKQQQTYILRKILQEHGISLEFLQSASGWLTSCACWNPTESATIYIRDLAYRSVPIAVFGNQCFP